MNSKYKILKLGELVEVKGGKRLPKNGIYSPVPTEHPYLRVCDFTAGSIREKDLCFITNETYSRISNYIISSDDVYISIAGTIGLCGIIPAHLSGSNLTENAAKLVIKDKSILDKHYLYLYLNSQGQKEIEQHIKVTSQPKLALFRIKEIEIPLPPLEEQKRIAAILDKADRVRRKRQESIRSTEELGRSIFLDMFGDPVTNPKGWNFQKLGELLSESLQNGAYYPKEQYTNSSHGTEMVHMSDAFYEKVKRGMLKRVNIPQPDIEKYGLSSNDILIARRSLTYEGAAKPCLISESKEPLIFESSLIRVRVNQDLLDPVFFYFYLSLPSVRQIYLFPNVTKSTISGINQAGLKRVEIILPPIDIQRRFREVYGKVGELKIRYELEHLKESENLFNSLLQRAFRGEL